ncbi:Hypothetical predicted protein [Octopus vulgaris]|uniref:Uncharacterized protein n=1 Tax=Octopus vulgaris TaxID=6645 RepID=A0AA36B0J1_OCTVU|nr:Hypothetical predicted protein [Octopus vulgaris]
MWTELRQVHVHTQSTSTPIQNKIKPIAIGNNNKTKLCFAAGSGERGALRVGDWFASSTLIAAHDGSGAVVFVSDNYIHGNIFASYSPP